LEKQIFLLTAAVFEATSFFFLAAIHVPLPLSVSGFLFLFPRFLGFTAKDISFSPFHCPTRSICYQVMSPTLPSTLTVPVIFLLVLPGRFVFSHCDAIPCSQRYVLPFCVGFPSWSAPFPSDLRVERCLAGLLCERISFELWYFLSELFFTPLPVF